MTIKNWAKKAVTICAITAAASFTGCIKNQVMYSCDIDENISMKVRSYELDFGLFSIKRGNMVPAFQGYEFKDLEAGSMAHCRSEDENSQRGVPGGFVIGLDDDSQAFYGEIKLESVCALTHGFSKKVVSYPDGSRGFISYSGDTALSDFKEGDDYNPDDTECLDGKVLGVDKEGKLYHK